MTEVLLALLAIATGVFMIFLGCMIGSELPALHGAELLLAGFVSFCSVVSGLMCITAVIEH